MSEDSVAAKAHPEVAGWVLGALGPYESAEFPGHLRECAGCAAELERLEPVRRLLDTAAPAVDPPAGLQARILVAVRRAAATRQRRRRASRLAAAAAGVILLVVLAAVQFWPQPGASVRTTLAATGLGGRPPGRRPRTRPQTGGPSSCRSAA